MKISDLRKHNAPLYKVYPGQSKPQGAYVEIRLTRRELPIDEMVSADWNGEVGNAVPFDVWYGRVIRLSLSPSVRGSVLADLLESDFAMELVARIAAGYREEWNGSTYVGKLSDDADDASYTLQFELDTLENYDDCAEEED